MRVTRIRRTLSLIVVLALVTSGASALIDVATVPAGATTTNVSVPSTAVLTDMGIALNAGQSVTITASGIVTIRSGPSPTTDETPDGNGETSSDGMSCSSVGAVAVAFPLGNVGRWSLIGEVGSGPLFEVGSSLAFTASASGDSSSGSTTTRSATTQAVGRPRSRRTTARSDSRRSRVRRPSPRRTPWARPSGTRVLRLPMPEGRCR